MCECVSSACPCASRLLYISLEPSGFLWDACERSLPFSRKKNTLSICSCQINISYFKSSNNDTLWILFSSSSLVLCYPAQSSSFVCLYPFSPMKGNWKQRLQLVRQLDSCFVSSTHPLSHTLIAILSSSHLSLALHLLLYLFFSPRQAWRSIWNHVSLIFAVMYFCFHDTERIYNSLCPCCSFAIYRSSFIFLSACLSVSSSLSTGARLVIHHRVTGVTNTHTHTQTESHAST